MNPETEIPEGETFDFKLMFIGNTKDWPLIPELRKLVRGFGPPNEVGDMPMRDRILAIMEADCVFVVEHLCNNEHRVLIDVAHACGIETTTLRRTRIDQDVDTRPPYPGTGYIAYVLPEDHEHGPASYALAIVGIVKELIAAQKAANQVVTVGVDTGDGPSVQGWTYGGQTARSTDPLTDKGLWIAMKAEGYLVDDDDLHGTTWIDGESVYDYDAQSGYHLLFSKNNEILDPEIPDPVLETLGEAMAVLEQCVYKDGTLKEEEEDK